MRSVFRKETLIDSVYFSEANILLCGLRTASIGADGS